MGQSEAGITSKEKTGENTSAVRVLNIEKDNFPSCLVSIHQQYSRSAADWFGLRGVHVSLSLVQNLHHG